MSAAAARAVLRPSRLALRRAAPARHASTASEAATKAKDTASTATSKASEGLTKVQSSAGAAGTAAAGAITARAGALVNVVNTYLPGVVYYSRVGAELARIVFHGQKMYPPTVAQFQSYFQPVINTLRSPGQFIASNPGLLNPQQYLNYVRNMSSQQMATVGIITAEVIGFFKVGEILGRFKIVGYRGDNGAHH